MGAARGGPPEGVSRKGWARRVGLVGWAGRGGPGGVGLMGPEGVGRKGCAGWGPEGVHPAAGSGTLGNPRWAPCTQFGLAVSSQYSKLLVSDGVGGSGGC
jgi:hypothetical protein